MQIEMVDTKSITPDKLQPRTIIDQKQVEEMAISIITEGIINPIEIDKNHVIITGELRWRAAQVAQLQQVPCKIIEINPQTRFRRQVIENLHHNSMNIMDTARALEKLLAGIPPGGPLKGVQGGVTGGISQLSREIGKSDSWIAEELSYLKESAETQEYLETPEAHSSLIREINRHAPEEIKSRLKRKVTSGELEGRETVNEIIRAVKRTPDKKDELLAQEYKEGMPANLFKIHKISPPLNVIPQTGVTDEEYREDVAMQMNNSLGCMIELMMKIDPDDLSKLTLQTLFANANGFLETFSVFFSKVKAILDRKVLEGEIK